MQECIGYSFASDTDLYWIRPWSRSTGSIMSSLLYSLGRIAFRRRRRVVGAWLLVLVVAGALAGVLSQGLSNNFVIPGTPSQQALDELAVRFPQVSGGQAQMVVVAPAGQKITEARYRTSIETTV